MSIKLGFSLNKAFGYMSFNSDFKLKRQLLVHLNLGKNTRGKNSQGNIAGKKGRRKKWPMEMKAEGK